jgi:hypothetical protein
LDFHSNQIITAHCILEEWDLKSALLETFEFNTEHTATNIATELIRVANKWNIQDKIVCIVTNNAANMIVAVRETGWRHLPCFAHSLNLVIQDSLMFQRYVEQHEAITATLCLLGHNDLCLSY